LLIYIHICAIANAKSVYPVKKKTKKDEEIKRKTGERIWQVKKCAMSNTKGEAAGKKKRRCCPETGSEALWGTGACSAFSR
jgi:hypothetical protein